MARWLTPEFAAEHPECWWRSSAACSPPPHPWATPPAAARSRPWTCAAISGGSSAPTLVVAAAQDPSTPPEHGEAIAAAIAGARFELLAPSAHIAAVERAGEVTALIGDHLA